MMQLLYKKIIFISLLLGLQVLFIQSKAGDSKDKTGDKTKVMVMEIRAEIDPAMARYVEIALKEAKRIEADYLIVDMDTYGGTLNDADRIRKDFLDFKKPVYVFINKNAASAGALISISCDSIYMAPGSNFGAATVVGQDGQPVPDKYQAYMRSMMRSTAQANGRDPKFAEAMVGKVSGADSVTIGKVLSFTTEEAIANDYCEGKVNDIKEILQKNNIRDYELVKFELDTINKIEAIFLNPFLRGILLLLILGGLYFEVQAPGLGLPIVISIVSAVLYFVPLYLSGLAAYWEILLFIIGIVLIIAELFFIPGFGIIGIAGLLLTFGSLVLVMLDNDAFDFSLVNPDSVTESVFVVLVAIAGTIVLFIVAGPKFLESKSFKRLTLQDSLDSSKGYTSNFNKESMLGKLGISYTVLRPSGKVMIEGKVYDAYTRGDFVEKGQEIIVVEETGTSLKVKKIEV